MKDSSARALLLSFIFGLSACTSPLWWHDPQNEFTYRGYKVRVVSQAEVVRACSQWNKEDESGGSFLTLGCVSPATAEAWSVNNPYILAHECSHIDAFTDGSVVSKDAAAEALSREGIKDALMTLTGVNELLTLVTWPFPAGDCF
ncbi:MAG: hypothetical protein ACE5IC_10790 [Candidatus Brocadiales bacterium]